MLIEKAEIERVKRANDLVELVRGRGSSSSAKESRWSANVPSTLSRAEPRRGSP
jgi:hypothetical protein